MVQAVKCRLGKHERSRRQAKLVGDQWLSACRSCGISMLRVKEQTWVVDPKHARSGQRKVRPRIVSIAPTAKRVMLSSSAVVGAALIGGATLGVQATGDIEGARAAGQVGPVVAVELPRGKSDEVADAAGSSLAASRGVRTQAGCARLEPQYLRGCLSYVSRLRDPTARDLL